MENLAMRERARRAFAAVDNCQALRRALILQKSRPTRGQYVQGCHVMMWKRKGEADGSWIGPLRVVIQESPDVVWITMGHKLFRVAPEHLCPLPAMEEWQQHQSSNGNQDSTSSETNLQSIIPPHGGIQYHNLISNSTPNSHDAPNPPSNMEGSNTQQPLPLDNIPVIDNPESSTPETPHTDQPDGEPIPHSQAPSETPAVVPNPVEVPVPISDDDDELFAEENPAYHLSTEEGWCLEVDIGAQDIANWKAESQPHEMAFLVSAAKRQRSDVKLIQLSTEDKARFQEGKMKEIDSWGIHRNHHPNP